MATRADVVAEARTWLGTPFKHQGRVKGAGVDCVGLLFGIAWALGWQHANEGTYGHRPDPRRMRLALAQHMQPIAVKEVMPADVYWMAFDNDPSHVALVTEHGILHAAASLRRVVEHRLDPVWQARIRGAYRFRELADG